jgi:hypothetical protein
MKPTADKIDQSGRREGRAMQVATRQLPTRQECALKKEHNKREVREDHESTIPD